MGRRCGKELVRAKGMRGLERLLQVQSGKQLEVGLVGNG